MFRAPFHGARRVLPSGAQLAGLLLATALCSTVSVDADLLGLRELPLVNAECGGYQRPPWFVPENTPAPANPSFVDKWVYTLKRRRAEERIRLGGGKCICGVWRG
jgi:hypothetical protein